MKCHSCGYELHIEEEKCPHCGTANPYYIKHRADMSRYEKDYSSVRQDVYAKTGFFTGLTVKITIIAVLVALELGLLVLNHYSWDIIRWKRTNQAVNNYEEYKDKLDELEESGQFIEFNSFYCEKYLHTYDKYEEYTKVQRMANHYQYVYEGFMSLGREDDYRTPQEKIKELCSNLESLYKAPERLSYDADECYSERHTQAMQKMLEDVEAFLVTYGGLTREEAQNFPNLSNARKQLALEKGLNLDEN